MNNENVSKINICIKDMYLSNFRKNMEVICKSYEEAKLNNDKEEMSELEKDLNFQKQLLFSSEKYLNDINDDEINNKIKTSTDKKEVSRYKCFRQLKKEYAKNIGFIDSIAKSDSISDVSKLLKKDAKKRKRKNRKTRLWILAGFLITGALSLFGCKKGYNRINDNVNSEIMYNNDSIDEEENELNSSEIKDEQYNSNIEVDESYKTKYDDINIEEVKLSTIPETVILSTTPVSESVVTEQELTPNLPEKPAPDIIENIVPEIIDNSGTNVDNSQDNYTGEDNTFDDSEGNIDVPDESQKEEDDIYIDIPDEPQDEEEELKPTDDPDGILEDNDNFNDDDLSSPDQTDYEEELKPTDEPTEIEEDENDIIYPEGKDIINKDTESDKKENISTNTDASSNNKENVSTNTDADSEPQDEEDELKPTDGSSILTLNDEQMQQEYGISGFEIDEEGQVLILHM